MSDIPAAIARHKEVLASGEHLLSGLKMHDLESDDGDELVVELAVDDRMRGPRGALQGGLLATLADIVGGRLAMRSCPDDGIIVTTDLTVHYLAPVLSDVAHARASVLRRGKRSIVLRVDVYDGADGPLAGACTLAFSIRGPSAI